MPAWTDLGNLSSTLAVLCTVQRWWRVVGDTSSSAFQKPSAPSPVASSGAIAEPAPLEVDQQLPPALRALPHAHLEADQFLLALRASRRSAPACTRPAAPSAPAGRRRRPRHRRSAGPTGRAAASAHSPPPTPPQPRDHRRRQVRGVAAQQRGERLLEVARRDPAQVEDRQQRIQARVRRAHFGRIDEVKRIRSSALTSPRSRSFTRRTSTGPIPVWITRSGPCPCRTRRSRPSGSCTSFHTARNVSASASIAWASSRRAPSRARLRQRIVDRVGLTEVGQRWYLSSWRIAPSGGSGRLVTRLDTPPSQTVITQFRP